MSEANKGPIWDARFSPKGSPQVIPLSPQNKLVPQLAAGFLFSNGQPGLPEREQFLYFFKQFFLSRIFSISSITLFIDAIVFSNGSDVVISTPAFLSNSIG